MYEIGLKDKAGNNIFNNNFVRKNFDYDIDYSDNLNDTYEFVTLYDNISPHNQKNSTNPNYYENSSKKPSVAKDDIENAQISNFSSNHKEINGINGYDMGGFDNYITLPLVVIGPQIYSYGYPFKIAIPFRSEKSNFKENLQKLINAIKMVICKEWNLDKTDHIDNFVRVILRDEKTGDAKICSVCSFNLPNTKCLKKNCILDFKNFENLFKKTTKLKLEIVICKWFDYCYPKRYIFNL